MDLNQIKDKIAKCLRLQQSNNVGEATSAANMVEKLCRQYGISSSEVSADYDPEKDEVIQFYWGRSFKKSDIAVNLLLNAVVDFYNGEAIITPKIKTMKKNGINIEYNTGYKQMSVVATKANRIQIELYLEYLLETMERLSEEAKVNARQSTRAYKLNFRKGFSVKISERLKEMKKNQERIGKPDSNMSRALVCNRNAMERKAVYDKYKELYPRTRSSRYKARGGTAYEAGKSKAEGVGLNKQTNSTKPTLALTGK